MRYLINANFASHFAGIFFKTTLIYLTFKYKNKNISGKPTHVSVL